MARITVEDCLKNVKNRFELVMLAAKRARQLMRGSVDPTVPWENDKATVVALREIANGHTNFSDAHEIDMVPKAPQKVEIIQEDDIDMDLDDEEVGPGNELAEHDEADHEETHADEHHDSDADSDDHSEFHEETNHDE